MRHLSGSQAYLGSSGVLEIRSPAHRASAVCAQVNLHALAWYTHLQRASFHATFEPMKRSSEGLCPIADVLNYHTNSARINLIITVTKELS